MKSLITATLRDIALDAVTELARQLRDTQWTITVTPTTRPSRDAVSTETPAHESGHTES